MKCVICAIAKQENNYLYEWAKYHVNIGFEHIYLYDNNDIDGEKPQIVFRHTDLQDKVSIIDVRGKKYQQLVAYQHCSDTFTYDWCAFIDIDEFITFSKDSGFHTITDYLQSFSTKIQAIHINWLCFNDNGYVRKQKNILQSYTNSIYPLDFCYTYDNISENRHIKSIIRGGIICDWCMKDENGKATPHTPNNLCCVANVRGGVIDNTPFADIILSPVYIRHYITKSLEDYYVKIQRQAADWDGVVYRIGTYFRINHISLRKLLYISKKGKIPWKEIGYQWLKYRIINYHLPLRFLIKSLRMK